MRIFKLRFFILLLLTALGSTGFYLSEGIKPVKVMNADTEAKVKAAFIFNFTRFVTWKPANDKAPLVIAIFGSEKISAALEAHVKEKKLTDDITVVFFDRAPSIAEGFDLLFIDNSRVRFANELLRLCSGKNILTVSDIEDFAMRGGIIEMYSDAGRIKLSVNLTSADKSGLKISAKLLELAKVVK